MPEPVQKTGGIKAHSGCVSDIPDLRRKEHRCRRPSRRDGNDLRGSEREHKGRKPHPPPCADAATQQDRQGHRRQCRVLDVREGIKAGRPQVQEGRQRRDARAGETPRRALADEADRREEREQHREDHGRILQEVHGRERGERRRQRHEQSDRASAARNRQPRDRKRQRRRERAQAGIEQLQAHQVGAADPDHRGEQVILPDIVRAVYHGASTPSLKCWATRSSAPSQYVEESGPRNGPALRPASVAPSNHSTRIARAMANTLRLSARLRAARQRRSRCPRQRSPRAAASTRRYGPAHCAPNEPATTVPAHAAATDGRERTGSRTILRSESSRSSAVRTHTRAGKS